jgi:diguanylate cyclase (GGDEF)-like protein
MYLLFRFLATATLFSYVILRNNSIANWVLDLLLFNSIALLTILSLSLSPIPDDHLSRIGVGAAISLWTLGSVVSSIDTFFAIPISINIDLIAETFYALFYPAALFGLLRALRSKVVSRSLELLDTLIIALGVTTILAAFLIRPAMTEINGSTFQVFLAILYPVGDIVLFVTVLTLATMKGLSARTNFLLMGVGIYALSDFYFLYISQSGGYEFGSLTDIGWLIGFILISEGFWHASNEEQGSRTFNPTVATIALLGSSAILAISVLQPSYFPRFIIAPAFATIALSFLRMGVAINDARNMSNEQILARTDELTGLANRRKFMTEFESFVDKSGSVLILDLDGFKPVNDTRGHDVGDQLLRQVARRFERVIPHDSLLARLGGDEFGALIRGEEGHDVALALRATLSYPFTIDGVEIALDVSVGEAKNSPGAYPMDLLLRRADVAMYEAKRSKAGVVTWHDELGVTGSRL